MELPRVIIVDTDIQLYEYSVSIWASYGIKSHRVDTLEEALAEITAFKYHLIVIVVCKKNSPQVANSINLFRELTHAPIVIMSTCPIGAEYKITGFDMGADEVCEMPECIEVVVAKGNAIIRRYLRLNKEKEAQSMIIANKHIILSAAQRLVFVKGSRVELTRIEFDILTMLLSYPGQVFTYGQIFREVWGEEYTANAKEVLRNRVCRLREKLKVDPSLPNYIKTNQGIGYSFAPGYDML